ncbi:MAG: peptidyl-prolyl cis-trans isomerase SurA, partial [Hyphomonadaceae bacterium]
NNISALDLGQVAATDLSEVFNSNLQNLRQNQSTNVFRSAQGVHVLVVCDVVLSGPDIPTREQIEDQLTDQELSLIARRYLRDLRREAAVNTRF